uniref:Uncharacterized protein n=1 Tax=Noccaea caerulescens TaxID=107243 RepID=A0A1J3K641_NOCCA
MYLAVAKMRRFISESISNSAVSASSPTPLDKEHSAMEPVHSAWIGAMKSAANPADCEVAEASSQWTVRIAKIGKIAALESPLIIVVLSLSLKFLCEVQKFYERQRKKWFKRERNGLKENATRMGNIYGLCHLMYFQLLRSNDK